MAEERVVLVSDKSEDQLTELELVLVEEVRKLRQQLAHVYQAWVTGQPPPPPLPSSDLLKGIPTTSISTPVPPPQSTDSLFSYGFGPAYNLSTIAGTSSDGSLVAPSRNTPVVTPLASIFITSQPVLAPEPINESRLVVHDRRYLPPERFNMVGSRDEMARKMKSLEQDALKATTQAIQNGSRNFRFKKKKEYVMMVTKESGQGFKRPPRHYTPSYPEAPTQCVYPQNVQVPSNRRPRQDYEKNQRSRDAFTPIGESYADLYQRLRNLNMIGVLPQNNAHPNSKGFNSTARCAYHSDAPGHSTEECRSLKREVERMIRAKLIVVQNGDHPNVTENSLPTRSDVNFMERICYDKKCDSPHNA